MIDIYICSHILDFSHAPPPETYKKLSFETQALTYLHITFIISIFKARLFKHNIDFLFKRKSFITNLAQVVLIFFLILETLSWFHLDRASHGREEVEIDLILLV